MDVSKLIADIMRFIQHAKESRGGIAPIVCYIPDDEYAVIEDYCRSRYGKNIHRDPGWHVRMCGVVIRRLSAIPKTAMTAAA